MQVLEFWKGPREWTLLEWSDHFDLVQIFGADEHTDGRTGDERANGLTNEGVPKKTEQEMCI